MKILSPPFRALVSFGLSLALAAVRVHGATFSGAFVEGEGDVTKLEALDAAFDSMRPSPRLACLPLLYKRDWNGFGEAPSWPGWWIQNSFGTTYGLQPFLGEEPYASWIGNANGLWFRMIGDKQRKGLFGLVGPDGCLCDAVCITLNGGTQNGFGDMRQPSTTELPVDGKVLVSWVAYKQGDAAPQRSDWFIGATAAGLVMESDRLLFRHDAKGSRVRLGELKRVAAFLDSRRDPKTNLLLCGLNSNLLAPTYAGGKNPDGSMGFGLLTEVSVNYAAGLERLAEVCLLCSDKTAAKSYLATAKKVKSGLARMMEKDGYFIRSEDPDGTRHGVFGAKKHGYFEAHPNQDAGAFRITTDAQNARIVDFMLNKVKGAAAPGSLVPHGFVLPNYPGYDDHSADVHAQYGKWTNGGVWPAHEGVFAIACFRAGLTAHPFTAFKTMRLLMEAYRNDAPLAGWGKTPWDNQLSKPYSFSYDAWGPAAGLARGLFEYAPSAMGLRLWPHVPQDITRFVQKVPATFGKTRVFIAATGSGEVTKVMVNNKALTIRADGSVFLPLDGQTGTVTVEFLRGNAVPRGVPTTVPADGVPPASDTQFWTEAPPEFTAARSFLDAMKRVGQGQSFEAAQTRVAIELLAAASTRRNLRAAGKIRGTDLKQTHKLPPANQDQVDKLYRDTARWILGGVQDHLRGVSLDKLPVDAETLRLAREAKLIPSP